VSGYFWVPEKPDAAVWGAFAADGGHKPEVILVAGLVDDPRVIKSNRAGGRAFISSGAAAVKAFQPITLSSTRTTTAETAATSDRHTTKRTMPCWATAT